MMTRVLDEFRLRWSVTFEFVSSLTRVRRTIDHGWRSIGSPEQSKETLRSSLRSWFNDCDSSSLVDRHLERFGAASDWPESDSVHRLSATAPGLLSSTQNCVLRSDLYQFGRFVQSN